jgi:hypothetical protein
MTGQLAGRPSRGHAQALRVCSGFRPARDHLLACRTDPVAATRPRPNPLLSRRCPSGQSAGRAGWPCRGGVSRRRSRVRVRLLPSLNTLLVGGSCVTRSVYPRSKGPRSGRRKRPRRRKAAPTRPPSGQRRRDPQSRLGRVAGRPARAATRLHRTRVGGVEVFDCPGCASSAPRTSSSRDFGRG